MAMSSPHRIRLRAGGQGSRPVIPRARRGRREREPDPGQRAEITASPNRATVEQLRGLPPAFVCVDEADPPRDEGESYAAKLRAAGVPVTTVRYDGTIHDFMLLNPLSETKATRAAIREAIAQLRAALGTA